ncbi:MAG: methylated-DNA--[protein]-cysteine S-methyltransferase [Flavobacteriales bacterium]
MKTAYIKTPLGALKITGNQKGISSVVFIDKPVIFSKDIPKELKKAVQQLHEYFNGERTIFTLTLNPVGTAFQKKVWNELIKIPFNETVSYKEIALRLGDLKVIRAAASANGKNPISIIIPCHRVIGSDGSLTGYAGGLNRKKWLLEHESPIKQISLF